MEGGPFLDGRVQRQFKRFVGVILHTDGQDEKYRDSSRRNQELQIERYGTRALPYYVLLDPTGTKVYWERAGVFPAEELLEALRKVPSGERRAELPR